MVVLAIIGVVLPMLLAAAFLLGRHWQRRRAFVPLLSPVSRQHINLVQGGELSEQAVEAAKRRIGEQLERGELAAVEASLRPGTQFVVQVRALAEIGTEEAAYILERQLKRRLSEDPLEQSWYWIDLASGLRTLNRAESLPQLLRCAEAACELPLGHLFAAETACFLAFAGYLRQPNSTSGEAAVRVLQRALEGMRFHIQPYLLLEARLGELIECLWDYRPEAAQPVVVRAITEALRLLRRAPQFKTMLAQDAVEHEAFDLQMARLQMLEPALLDYLEEAPQQLCAALETTRGKRLREMLLALLDLRADTGAALLPYLSRADFEHELAVEVLTWSRAPEVGEFLRSWIQRHVCFARRSRGRPQAEPPRKPSFALTFPYHAILRALRTQPGTETETLLLAAARDWDPTYRSAAVSSLGWWEPICRDDVLATLQQGLKDPSAEVRQAARASLARLGERRALQWFREALTSDQPQRLHAVLQVIALEGLTLLWPDVDRLADAEDRELAHLAREALEQMCEQLQSLPGR